MADLRAQIPFADLRALHDELRDELDEAIRTVVDSSAFILGPDVDAFEREFAAYCEADHCVGVASGTAALGLVFEALGIGAGDEVIAPANTFVATVMPLLHLGARPVLVDCDPETALIDTDAAAAAVTERTRAIVPVHLYGQPADIDPLRELCERRDIALVEDAAQAHGARYRGRRVGALGAAGCFSFYPGKNLGAFGDAGAVVTADGELAERLRWLRDLGQARKYEHVVAGHNERLDTIQAAVLRVKLRHLDRWNELRREAAAAYEDALTGTDVALPLTAPEREHVWHLYVVRSTRRDELRAALERNGVETGLHYPRPVHLQPALAELGHREGDFPASERWSREGLSLPMFPGLGRREAQEIATAAGLAQ
jgi:dTDP-4-amino-4,6-dideoxygalactose transaminase